MTSVNFHANQAHALSALQATDFQTKRFVGRTVMVTGASSGIGLAVARAFASEGAQLVLIARRKESLDQIAKDLRNLYQTNVKCLVADVSKELEIEEALNSLPEEFAHPDFLINSAGLARGFTESWKAESKDMHAMIDTNFKGVTYVTNHVVRGMLHRNSGHIINIGSVASIEYYAKGAVYCASKAALEAYTVALRKEVVSKAIRVSLISPGMVETEFSLVRLGTKEAAAKVYENFIPLTPEDISAQVIHIAAAPPHVNVAHIEIYPLHQASATTIYRKT